MNKFWRGVAIFVLGGVLGTGLGAQSPPILWEALPIYGPSIRILVAKFTLRSRRKLEERHGDAVPA